ncbi:MAG: transposase-like zinc-binding domain-containing protein [Pseudanabaena sp.]
MGCPHCQSQKIIKNGKHHHQDGKYPELFV